MSNSDEERVASSASASTSDQPATAAAGSPAKKAKVFQQIAMPTQQELAAQEFMNNCLVKSALSGAMGGLAGLAFGLFTASMENAHGVGCAPCA
jgi:import inner membrane translocase subunit TIM22